MKSLNSVEIYKFLANPIGKKVELSKVEQWSASLWRITRDLQQEPSSSSNRGSFTMMFPPPNITGNLHLGHAVTASVQDALVRQKRMDGKTVTWIPGFDHAGLATQALIAKQLWSKSKVTPHDVGRDKFIELTNEWKNLKENEMRRQLDRLGLELDWDMGYFTMDSKSSVAVQTAYKKLFDLGLIYRDTKPVFWSKEQNTTLSDIEVECDNGINRYFRTGEIVKKRNVPQWFINAEQMAHQSVEAVNNGTIEIIPSNYKNSWSSWLTKNGVQDWCISRQSWWGHRIPAFKVSSAPDVQQSWIIADNKEDAEMKLGSSDILQDPDVLDTWFSSSLLPLTISGWPEIESFRKSIENDRFPLHILETGFDILNYWVSKMTMMSLVLTKQVPFRLVLLHGMVCDSEGKKMSKSKGNVVDPMDVIEGASLAALEKRNIDLHSLGIIEDSQLHKSLEILRKLFPNGIPCCNADGLRGYLLSHDIQEEVVRIRVDQMDKVRRLTNKIWNVCRYVESQMTESCTYNYLNCDGELKDIDRSSLDSEDEEVLHKLELCVATAEESFNKDYQLHRTFNTLEHFWFKHLSSSYLAASKDIMSGKTGSKLQRDLKLQIMIGCVMTATKLLHPFMPHLTEYLYQRFLLKIFPQDSSDQNQVLKLLSTRSFPKTENFRFDKIRPE